MIFLFDRCIAERLVRMIAVYEIAHTVRYLDDKFDRKTKDVDWITAAAAWEQPPVVITADNRMRCDPVERQALAASKLTIVFLKAGFHDLLIHTQAVKLLTVWPEIVTETLAVREPTAFEISPQCKRVELIGRTSKLAN